MNITQPSNPSQKKTSIVVNELTTQQSKGDLQKFQKKKSAVQIVPLNNATNTNYCSVLPSINTVLSTSNLSSLSLHASDETVRRIVKQQMATLIEQMSKNNVRIQNDFTKTEQNIQSLWKGTKLALDQTTFKIQKQTSQKLEIILGGIKKAMVEIQKELKAEIINEVSTLPNLQRKTFEDITERVNIISQHVFKSPYEKEKPYQNVINEMKEINKQIQIFNQCNMTLFNELNKIKSTVAFLSKSKPPQVVPMTSTTSIKNFRPLSAASSNIQFKQPSSKTLLKSNKSLSSMNAAPNMSAQNSFSYHNLTSVAQIKVKDQIEERITYQVDSQGRLQDSSGNYLLNEDDQYVFVEEEHMNELRKFDMLIQ